MKYYTQIKGQEFVIEVDQENQILVNGEPYEIDLRQLPEAGLVSLLLNNRSLEAVVESNDNTWDVLIQGELFSVKVQDERAYFLSQARKAAGDISGEATVNAPMPGLIVAVPVEEGDTVKSGDKVVILESMKMENELRAPRDGVIVQVNVAQGDSVEKNQVLVAIGEEEAEE